MRGRKRRAEGSRAGNYWPIWVHLGWGFGLASHAYAVYKGGGDAVAREEEKIRAKLGR